MPSPLRIVVCGATGRTGSRAAALAEADARFAPPVRLARGGDLKAALRGCGAVVDFSVPSETARLAVACAAARVPLATGVTGLSSAQRARVAAAARRTAVLAAPNFSRGAALLLHLAAEAARRLPGFDAAVVETHHKAKKDSPSGTALRLAEAVARGRGRPGVPTASIRIGDVVGDHVLSFAGPHERLELSHRAQSRDVFALGALEAALWLAGRKAGLYDMRDLLGLR